jgi:hypothetical protein
MVLLMSTLLPAFAQSDWKQVLEHAPFEPRDSAGELVFQNKMWIIGGYLPHLNDDVWCSSDGATWEKVGAIGAKGGINIPINLVFDNKMWVSSNDGELFASSDGKEWQLVNAAPPWAGRYAASGAVFKNRMWVLGGQSLDKSTLFNDVWSSRDGVNWKRETEHAAWSPRQLFSNVVVKDNKLWMIGGGITRYDPFEAYQDVWNSSDGVHWNRVLDRAPWPARIWSTCIVYHDHFFLLDGFQAQPTRINFNDVWYSGDGKTWRQLKTETIWKERHEASVLVFNDKLWVIAGMGWPLVNDVWSLQLPQNFPDE